MATKIRCIVGIDEVGRGPLAGPVTVCACTVAPDFDFTHFTGIKDSKQLSAQKREQWFLKISELKSHGLLDYAHTSIPAEEIDSIGISKSIQKAIQESLRALSLVADATEIFLDGSLKAPKEFEIQQTIIKGDEKIPIISAASIIAKVIRDRHMEEQAILYPAYGFETHKGYGTSSHYKAIHKHGISPLHRRSFLKKLTLDEKSA